MRQDAFPLIELAIVLATIAIVAAMVVPNLLATQMRAIVSGGKGELRTLRTASVRQGYPHSVVVAAP